MAKKFTADAKMSVSESTADASMLSELVSVPATTLISTSATATATDTAAARVRRWPASTLSEVFEFMPGAGF
jgi:hypothetical protein